MVLIEGTKIKFRANRYTFVWKKHDQGGGKLLLKSTEMVQKCEEAFGLKIVYREHTLKRLRKKLYVSRKKKNFMDLASGNYC